MHLHSIPPHKVQKSPPLNVQSYTQCSLNVGHCLKKRRVFRQEWHHNAAVLVQGQVRA
jgi:hypothetical protein